MTTGFDTIVMVDWSARSVPSPVRRTRDAIFIGMARNGRLTTSYQRTRHAAMRALTGILDGALRAGRRVLAGFDFPFGYPRGFARAVTGSDDPLTLWAHLAAVIEDDARNRNNRFDVAERLNRMFDAPGPFWGCPARRASPEMPFRRPDYSAFGFSERRRVETRVRRAKPLFQLMGNGSVGSQSLLGLPLLHDRLRGRYGRELSVSPFQPPDTPIVLAEIYPGLIGAAIRMRIGAGELPDAAQVRLLARAFSRLPPARLDALLRGGDAQEGWILGLGAEAELVAGLG